MKENNIQKLGEKIAELIYTDKELILDQYSSKLTEYYQSKWKRQPIPKWLFVILRARYADILERQVSYLRTGQYCNSKSFEDKSYAIQVVPFCSQDLRSTRLILTMELFTGTVVSHIFNKMKEIGFIPYSDIAPLLDKLSHLAYEDLWITTIVSHGFQRNIIQELLKKKIKVHEDERREIAIGLHDGVLQSLATALVETQILEKLMKMKNQKRGLKRELLYLRKVITDTVQKIRDLNYDLYPISLREQGLIGTLQGYMSGFQRETGISVHLVTPPSIDETLWGKDIQADIYRMIHELMTNVKKHAHADHVRIEISTTYECFRLTIEDNGIGFDLPRMLANLTTSGAFGLLSIREQTADSNGTIRIQTSPGHGTKIEIELPSDDKKVQSINCR